GFARLFFLLAYFLSHQSPSCGSVDDSKRAIPAGDLKQMGHSIGEMKEFITRSRRNWPFRVGIAKRPVDEQRAPDYVFARHKTPITAVEAFIAIVCQDEVGSFGNKEGVVVNQFFHLQPPPAFEARHGNVQPWKLVATCTMQARTVTNIAPVNLKIVVGHGQNGSRSQSCRTQGWQRRPPMGLLLFNTHHPLRARLRSPFARSGRDARYSSTWRAASCCAFFLVEPTARPMTAG